MFDALFLQFEQNLPSLRMDEVLLYKKHHEILSEWNSKINLVSRSSFDKAFAAHYVDSILISDFARPFVEDRGVFDLGTGAGFPGLLFAIRYPNLRVTLIERSQKKKKFLLDVVERLELKNVALVDATATGLGGFFFARAVYPPTELFYLFLSKLKKGGRFVLNLGGENKTKVVPGGFKNIFAQIYSLPQELGNRRIEIFERST